MKERASRQARRWNARRQLGTATVRLYVENHRFQGYDPGARYCDVNVRRLTPSTAGLKAALKAVLKLELSADVVTVPLLPQHSQ